MKNKIARVEILRMLNIISIVAIRPSGFLRNAVNFELKVKIWKILGEFDLAVHPVFGCEHQSGEWRLSDKGAISIMCYGC